MENQNMDIPVPVTNQYYTIWIKSQYKWRPFNLTNYRYQYQICGIYVLVNNLPVRYRI
jgi:hypothetical protein